MAVKENMKKQGIGKMLVNKVLEALKKEGINKVALLVINNNEVGNMFWENIGFEKSNNLVYRSMSITD